MFGFTRKRIGVNPSPASEKTKLYGLHGSGVKDNSRLDKIFRKNGEDNIRLYDVVTTNIQDTECVKPPFGLEPRDIWNQKRKMAIANAIGRYLEAYKRIPDEWLSELIELNNKCS